MKNQYIKIAGVTIISLLPSFAFAACTTTPGTLQNIVCLITDVAASYVVPLLTLAAFIFFLWRVLKFIQESGNSTKQTENRQSLMWSIVGLTVMVAIWGIVAVIGNTLGIDSTAIPQVKPPLTKQGWTGYTGSGTGSTGNTGSNNGGSNLGGNGGGSNLGSNGGGSNLGSNGGGSNLGGNGSVQ